jgi:predicted dienelactone hydrolase
VAFERRPQAVSQVIDALEKDPQWSTRLDMGKVGVHGMSSGGVTGLALAGGQWRLPNLVRRCHAHPVADEAFYFQGKPHGPARAERQARFDKAFWWPDFVLPDELKKLHGGGTPEAGQTDPRHDVVPLAAILSAESLARI